MYIYYIYTYIFTYTTRIYPTRIIYISYIIFLYSKYKINHTFDFKKSNNSI